MNQVTTETTVKAPAKTSLKDAMASVDKINKKAKEVVEKAPKQAAKRDNAKKGRAYEIITSMRDAGQNETAILKALQDELKITYPNAYYYTKRVFAK